MSDFYTVLSIPTYKSFTFSSGIIPAKYIAGVMNDGRFSGHLITEHSQIIMMDEWTPDSLSCEDAKRILQGR